MLHFLQLNSLYRGCAGLFCSHISIAASFSASMASQEVQSSPRQRAPQSYITPRTLTSMMRWETWNEKDGWRFTSQHVAIISPCECICLSSSTIPPVHNAMHYMVMSPQVKIELPTQLHEKHHLLFSFYHVTCDINAKTNSKRKETLETPGKIVADLDLLYYLACFFCGLSFPLFITLWFVYGCCFLSVGYSWLPLLKEGRLSSQEFNISVSSNLPPGYLAIKEASNTKVRGQQRREGGRVCTGCINIIQIQLNSKNTSLWAMKHIRNHM